jgi:hypothetical protein
MAETKGLGGDHSLKETDILLQVTTCQIIVDWVYEHFRW